MSIELLVALIIIGLALATSVYLVQPKKVATVTRLGKYVRAGRPGLNFKLPFLIEQVDVELATALLQQVENVRVKTKDNAYVDMPIQIFYQVDESTNDNVGRAAYNLEDPSSQIIQLAAKEVRSHATSMTLDELFMDKDSMEKRVKEDLEEFVGNNGYHIHNVVIDEPTPSEEVQRASNDVIASQRLQDAATAKAEAIRIERVGEARADAEALTERAKAFSSSREIISKGMADAADAMRHRVTGLDDGDIIRVLEGVDWRDALISCSKGPGSVIIDTAREGHGLAETAGFIQSQIDRATKAPASTEGWSKPESPAAGGATEAVVETSEEYANDES